ncbi:hypothetical protein KI688_008080 [Linnemannia hyalina]|uniref:Uncharacterized protein n=1 Tax=Linnemannia hyalina TaxID=64524 RepID=A0A9P8BYX8_9FUNG|nr:hypothetical protein KI688_008080 [Linnemannia hyalina]
MNEARAQTIATTTITAAKRRSRSGAKHPPATTFTHLILPLPSATELTNQPATKKLQSKSNSALAMKRPSAAGSTSETDAGGPNPYLSLVFRRMRRLKKRVTRVETTEAALNEDPSKKATLEPDQLAALEKKLEMSASLKELEDLSKAMTVLQANDKLERNTQIDKHLRDIERSKETVTRETQESATSAFIQVIRLFYALKQLDDAKEYLTLPLSNSLKVLEKFRSRLFEVAQAAELSDGDDCIHSRKELYSMVRKLAEKSTDNVAEDGDITYKCIYDEIDHLTYPSADLELRDTPLISDGRQVDGPSSIVKAHTGAGKEDDIEGTSVRSLMSEPTLTVAQKSCATVENWFSKISSSNPPSSESPPKTTPGQESMAVAQIVNAKQAEPTPAVPVCLGREVASQTDPSASCEPSSLPAVTAPMVPAVVPLVPVHPMSGYRFMLPPWVAGSSYPADPHVSNPSLMQAPPALPGMHVSNEPGHSIFSQPDDKDSGKSDSRRRFGRPSGGPSQESTSFRAHRVSQKSYGESGDDRLGVIYEDDEKECGASSSARAHSHGQYVSYVPGPIYQEPRQLQATNPNQRGTQDRMVARTITESAGSEVRRGVSPLSGDQLRQQQAVYGHSSGVMTLQQSESTSFGYKVSGTGSKKELPTDNNNGGFQGRRSGKKKGRGQDRPPLAQTQHQQGGLKSQDQRSTESSSNLRPDAQQQQSIDNNGHNLQFLQHSTTSYHSHSDAQNQQYYKRMTQQQQQHLQQQYCHLDEQDMSRLPQQQQQQGVHHYIQQQAFYHYPGGGRVPVYCVQRQQIQQTQAEDTSKGQV